MNLPPLEILHPQWRAVIGRIPLSVLLDAAADRPLSTAAREPAAAIQALLPDEASPNLHLDKRADDLLLADAAHGDPDELLTRAQVASWLKISKKWLEKAHAGGYGPPTIKVSATMCRLRRGDVLAWLKGRAQRGA
jgi:hypothetical protein